MIKIALINLMLMLLMLVQPSTALRMHTYSNTIQTHEQMNNMKYTVQKVSNTLAQLFTAPSKEPQVRAEQAPKVYSLQDLDNVELYFAVSGIFLACLCGLICLIACCFACCCGRK